MNWKVISYWLLGGAICLVSGLAIWQPELPAFDEAAKAAAAPGVTSGAGGSGGAPTLFAQVQSITTTTTTTTHGGWTVTCSQAGEPPTKTCSAAFRVVSNENKALVLIWLLGRNKEGKLLAEFITPSDILIRPGVTVVLNESKQLKAEYVSCTAQQGCRASVELTSKTTRDLRSTARAKIGITLFSGQVMEVAFEILGIEQVLIDLGAD